MTDLSHAFAHHGVTVERELPGGHRNQVFLVRRGEIRLVAKTTRHSEAALQWLSPVFTAARLAGLEMPGLIPDHEGRLGSGGVTLELFVKGTCPDRAAFHRLQPRIRRLHALTRGMRPRPGPAYLAASMMSQVPAPLRAAIVKARDRLPAADPCAIHGDLTPSNVVMTATGPVLLDWDEARLDHPAFDLPLANPPAILRRARLAHEILSAWTIEPYYARRLVSLLRR